MSNSDGKELRTQVEQNKLRILFLTDTHLGFLENDPIRGQDSFNSFSEILELAKKYDVDLILHGGDLYHDNRPSKNTENQCIQLIRSHTFGNKQLKFEFLSNKDYRANFEANQFSISYPIFAIHGNHDDRAGSKRVSALDILHSAGIINLFGNFDNVSSNIEIEPLLFSKGSTRLALFGIGSVKDERLYNQFK
ncbi:MAG: Double-strand break repair protein mre11a, partial [Marteilia pararefringens]